MKSIIVYQLDNNIDLYELHISTWIVNRYLKMVGSAPLILSLPFGKDIEPESLHDQLDLHYVGNGLTIQAVKRCILQHHIVTLNTNDYFYADLINATLGNQGITLYPVPSHLQNRLRVNIKPGLSLPEVVWAFYFPNLDLPLFVKELEEFKPVIDNQGQSYSLYDDLCDLKTAEQYKGLKDLVEVIKLDKEPTRT